MGLKYSCYSCNQEVIVYYLKKGSISQCPFCGTKATLPNTAIETEESATPRIFEDKKTKEEIFSPVNIAELNPTGMLDLKSRTKFVVVMLWIMLAMEVVFLISNYMEYDLLHSWEMGEYVSTTEAEMNDGRQIIVSFTYIFAYIVTSIVLLMWFYRAHKNLYYANLPGIKYKSGWAIGGFFVPFLNLVRPFQVMTETWRGSQYLSNPTKDDFWQASKIHPIIIWWWVISLLTGFFARLTLRYLFRTETIEDFVLSAKIAMANNIFGIPVAMVTIYMIKLISSKQIDAKANLHKPEIGQTSFDGNPS